MAKRREKKQHISAVCWKPNAAVVDIGAEEIFVAVPPDRDPEPVRKFSSFTCDLHALIEWLERCHIRTILHAFQTTVARPKSSPHRQRSLTG